MRKGETGVSLVDMMLVVAVMAVLMAGAVPQLNDVAGAMKLGSALRDVERELQTARLKAVTSNRPIRVSFNCPTTGQFRMVELIGTTTTPDSADSASNRCSESAYPATPADDNPLTRPNHDGPIRRLDPTVSFGSASTIEFWPDGSAHQNSNGSNPWPLVPSSGTAITLVRDEEVRTITVNSLGKIQIQQ
ncbi:MAG: Tfp pilus assembly protein FimT/FimU [Vicinamibacterales bacterium]